MADIAVVFHWSPADMNSMSLTDLAAWRERARVRHSAEE
jgi:hypothetical protein